MVTLVFLVIFFFRSLSFCLNEILDSILTGIIVLAQLLIYYVNEHYENMYNQYPQQ